TWVKENHSDFNPKSILDMGCTIGHSSIPYLDIFPGAEVHAIDVAAPCLEYGHYRAKSLGKAVHFSQQNAEKTNYPDESFDLIVSHILMHETSHKALKNIINECHRLLKPGGMMIHMDVVGADDPFGQYLCEWNAHYNNEPYMGGLQDEDLGGLYSDAGFPGDNFFMKQIESIHLPKTMPEVMKAKRAEGVVIGIGYYTIVGTQKA
ncbi:MAG: methyltransferase domain-containing protein, partial [Hyphomicrobiales bacterium]